MLGLRWGAATTTRSASGSASRSRRRGSPTSSPSARRSRCSAVFYPTGPRRPTRPSPASSLEEKARAYVGKLSGGQKQRLAVACALVGDPELLFLDEPTTGLDPQSRRQLWDVIRGFRDRGRTVLLTTHYMDEAERLCDRVAVVDHGKVIALGTPAELIARLGGEHVIEFALGRRRPAPAADELRRPADGAGRAARGRPVRPDRGRAARRPAGAARPLAAGRPRAGRPDHPARQPRRRVRHPDRPAPARRRGGRRECR